MIRSLIYTKTATHCIVPELGASKFDICNMNAFLAPLF